MNKKTVVRDIVIGLIFSSVIALLVNTVAQIALKPIPVFALLALFVVISRIKNQWLSFAIVAVVSVGVSYFYREYAIYCLPTAILVWSATLCRSEKVSPVFTILAQVGFIVSAYFCYTNRNTGITISNFFTKMNKYALIPIVIIAFIVFQNYSYEESEDDDDDKEELPGIMPIEKSKKTLMTSAYVWNAVFLFDMSLRFQTTVNVVLLWVCAMCYVIYLEEPMIINVFPFLKTFLDFSAGPEPSDAVETADDAPTDDTPDEVPETFETDVEETT